MSPVHLNVSLTDSEILVLEIGQMFRAAASRARISEGNFREMST